MKLEELLEVLAVGTRVNLIMNDREIFSGYSEDIVENDFLNLNVWLVTPTRTARENILEVEVR